MPTLKQAKDKSRHVVEELEDDFQFAAEENQ
jgi:hypothetical protein